MVVTPGDLGYRMYFYCVLGMTVTMGDLIKNTKPVTFSGVSSFHPNPGSKYLDIKFVQRDIALAH